MRGIPYFKANSLASFGLILLLGFISLGAVGGCSDSGGDNNDTQALTENDFSDDPSLTAFAGGTVVKFLEPSGGQTAIRDTGQPGVDIFPIRYTSTTEHTYCWEDDDQAAAHVMTLMDSDGQEILSVQANGDCATEIIERGNYLIMLEHDGLTQDTHPVFFQPIILDQALIDDSGDKGIIHAFIRAIKKLGIGTEARAQTVQQNIETLLKTRSCITCDLKKANLRGADLSSVNAEGSNFEGADLMNANFNCANLLTVVLKEANMIETNLSCNNPANLTKLVLADLSNAVLAGANASGADLEQSNLSGADLSDANFSEAILDRSNLTGAILNNTTFDSAAWCSGICNCAENSVDECVGCDPVSMCTGS